MEAHKAEEKFIIFNNDLSYENAIAFIIAFIEEYKNYQGYYDYYKGSYGSCVKLHYRGEFNQFTFDQADSKGERKHLIFNVSAKAIVEIPLGGLSGEKKVVQYLYEEIQQRACKDIILKLKSDLKNKLNNLFDLNTITLDFKPKWKLEIEEEDYF